MTLEKSSFKKGDKVKIIIDKVDLDMHYHGKKGKIIDISFDDAASVTGNSEDNFMFKVELESGKVPDIHFRRNDLKKVN
jgi:ribosomal protein L21E